MHTRFFVILSALGLLVSAVPAASALEGECLRAADTLAALNIVRGDYGLDAPATRAHAAVLLVRLAGAESKAAPITSRSLLCRSGLRPEFHRLRRRAGLDHQSLRPVLPS